MTVYKANNITKMDASPSVKIASSYVGGRLRVFYDEIDVDVADDDQIIVARLPVGAVVYDFTITKSPFSTVIVKLGDSLDHGRYTLSGLTTLVSMGVHGEVGGFGYKVTEETREIFITSTEVGGLETFTGIFKSNIVYALD